MKVRGRRRRRRWTTWRRCSWGRWIWPLGRRRRWWIFWRIWYDLQSDLTRLNCHVVGDAGAELPEDRWSWSLASQRPGLFSLSHDNAGGDFSAHGGAVGVIHDGEQSFRGQLEHIIAVSIPNKNGTQRALGASVLLGGLLLEGLLLKLPGLLTDRQPGLRAATQVELVRTVRPLPASHCGIENLPIPIIWVHEGLSPRHLVTVQPPVNAGRHRPDAPRPSWVGRRKVESLFRRTLRTAKEAVVIIDRVVSGEGVVVREEGHVALWLGQVDAQSSVAAGSSGTTGEGAKNPLVVGFLNDRLFSPATARGGGEEEEKKTWNRYRLMS